MLNGAGLAGRLLQPPDVLAPALGCSFGFCFGFADLVFHHGRFLILNPASEANVRDGVVAWRQVLARLVAVAQPVVNFFFRLGLAVAIALLQDTGEFFDFAAQSGEIIAGELAPLLSRLTLEFIPLAEQDIMGCI
jgi:hypothetical protein